jgi:PAS domain S-box-containing protein
LRLPIRLLLVVVTGVAAGAATLAVALLRAGDGGIGPAVDFVAFTGLLGVTWAYPLYVLKGDESEGLHLDEAFLVPMILLLPPVGVLAGFACAAVAAHALYRRPAPKIAFNAGQLVTAAGAAVGVFALLGGAVTDVDTPVVGALVLASAVFLVVNGGAVAVAISAAEGRRLRDVWRDGLALRLLVWVGSTSLGLLAAVAGFSHHGAVLLALAPLAVLHVVLRGYGRARRDRERMNGLFNTAIDAHRSIGMNDVSEALVRAATEQLRCRTGRVSTSPPASDELGTRLDDRRWLIVAERRSVESFDEADQRLLDAIAVIGSTAIDNATLYAEVAAERKKMTDVVTSSSDGILSVDVDQRIQSWNPAMARITGIPAGDAIGAKCYMVFRPRDEQGNELCIAHCPGRCDGLEANNDEPVNVQITTLANEQRWLTCTYSPLPDGGYVVVARDITTQKQVEDLKADFLATVSHELRTPLTPIQGFLHTLLREDVTFDDDHRRRFYEVMLRQSERLERLVKDLLDATSLQDSQQLFLPERVDWAGSVAHTVDLFRTQEPARPFVLEVAPSLPHVVADEQRAEQVLSNLVLNAIKYSPESAPVRVTVEEIDGVVRTTVFDGGPGVPAAERDRIFERFTRLGDHLTRRVGGAGLGLFIAKRLTEAMGGEISVDAAPEGGAAFSFTLPAYAGARTIQL